LERAVVRKAAKSDKPEVGPVREVPAAARLQAARLKEARLLAALLKAARLKAARLGRYCWHLGHE
jgi:hypothetical protein